MGTVLPEPGDFFTCSTGGQGGVLIAAAQRFAGAARRYAEYEHAGIYVGGGKIVQAEPGGATEVPVGGHKLMTWSTGVLPLTDEQRRLIVLAARSKVGVPYSWLDYAAIGLHRFHIPAPGLREYLAADGHMQCAQLVDWTWQQGGVQLFKGRWPGYVMPSDLAAVLLDRRGA
jgi:cell wall-associated NlpC family hydrolase